MQVCLAKQAWGRSVVQCSPEPQLARVRIQIKKPGMHLSLLVEVGRNGINQQQSGRPAVIWERCAALSSLMQDGWGMRKVGEEQDEVVDGC